MKKQFQIILIVAFLIILGSSITTAGLLNQNKIERIDNFIQENMEKFGVPGMALVIVQDGEVVFEKGYGVQKKGSDVKVNPHTNFCLASVSKSFTALAIVQLRDKGLLDLDDPVIKYLPWFSSKDKANSDKITIKHLLQHTSGIPTTAYGLEIKDGTEEDLEEQIIKLKEISLFAEPGTRWQYSNLNYWTQALIVEKITGQKFADYMAENVFEPMGMERTGYYRHIANLGNLSSGHRVEHGKTKFLDYRVPDVINAAGGLYSNANDMGQYLKTILAGGTIQGNQILPLDSMREVYTEGVSLGGGENYGYGWFFGEHDGQAFVDHGGDNPNFTAHITILPGANLGWALLSNSQHIVTHFLSGRIASIIQGQEPNPINSTSIEGRAQLAGILTYVAVLLGLITLIWIVTVVIGFIKKKYVFITKIHIARLIIQVILIPIIGLGVMIFALRLPAQMIGSYRIAVLYQPDLVKGLTSAVLVFAVLTLFIGFMGFVRKKSKIEVDASTKSV